MYKPSKQLIVTILATTFAVQSLVTIQVQGDSLKTLTELQLDESKKTVEEVFAMPQNTLEVFKSKDLIPIEKEVQISLDKLTEKETKEIPQIANVKVDSDSKSTPDIQALSVEGKNLEPETYGQLIETFPKMIDSMNGKDTTEKKDTTDKNNDNTKAIFSLIPKEEKQPESTINELMLNLPEGRLSGNGSLTLEKSKDIEKDTDKDKQKETFEKIIKAAFASMKPKASEIALSIAPPAPPPPAPQPITIGIADKDKQQETFEKIIKAVFASMKPKVEEIELSIAPPPPTPKPITIEIQSKTKELPHQGLLSKIFDFVKMILCKF